jgi:hypothetical protein
MRHAARAFRCLCRHLNKLCVLAAFENLQLSINVRRGMSARPTTRARLAPARARLAPAPALVQRLKGVVAAALALALLLRAGAEPEFEPLHCVACDAGFFRAQATKACTACPAGSSTFDYSNASSALDCLCAPGFENASELAQASGSCEPCAPAFFKGSLAPLKSNFFLPFFLGNPQ